MLTVNVQDSLEYKPDGHISMLGKSLRGDYVFSSEGDLIKAAGQSAGFYKVRWYTFVSLTKAQAVFCFGGVDSFNTLLVPSTRNCSGRSAQGCYAECEDTI